MVLRRMSVTDSILIITFKVRTERQAIQPLINKNEIAESMDWKFQSSVKGHLRLNGWKRQAGNKNVPS